MSSLINSNQVKQYVRSQKPDVRISKEWLTKLDSRVRVSIDASLRLGCNNKTLRDLNGMGKP